MPVKLEGQWRKDPHRGKDGCGQPIQKNRNMPLNTQVKEILLGEVLLPQPEPIWGEGLVAVSLARGGIVPDVAWPGPNVVASFVGIPSPVISGIHGLFEAPLPGQQVAIGFVEGNSQSPIVLQKYPYNVSQRPDLKAAHILPMTMQMHGPTDVVLGHHMGSYLAFRGTLPIPGAVEMDAVTTMSLSATVSMDISSLGPLSISSLLKTSIKGSIIEIVDTTGLFSVKVDPTSLKVSIESGPAGKVEIKTGAAGKVSIETGAGGDVDIKGGVGGNVNVKPGVGGMVNLGNAPLNFCNNLPVCLFGGSPHSTSIDVKA